MIDPPVDCGRCPRLVALREQVRAAFPHYHAAPVRAFGPATARLLVVGLAPALHGANASGRPFSGDGSGALIYRALHAHGFANQPVSTGPGDGLVLQDCRITNVVKCLPPQNKPVAAEVNACNPFLASELATARVVLALSVVAHKAIVRALGARQRAFVFAHGREHGLGGSRVLLDSYHCSRYNLNTKRLTEAMFADIFARARACIERSTLP
ncbi:Uracil-DNA glycosylase, family 5 [Salinisphaera sp. S4-8]|uniref:uracil-DNA glycosylase n=1 Tax=Salinisphaera sp. S4-8 TaxID=633357 RepID=UPI00333FDC8B